VKPEPAAIDPAINTAYSMARPEWHVIYLNSPVRLNRVMRKFIKRSPAKRKT
jgi:hypothetical protein